MMKLFVRSMAAAVAVSAVASTMFAQGTPSSAPIRLAYINSQVILQQAPGRAEAEATYDKEAAAVRVQLQSMDDSLKALFATLQKDEPTLDSARRVVREKAFEEQRNQYQQRAQSLNEQMQKRQADLARPLMDQMAKVLDEFRQKNGYSIIFDVATQASVIVSADKSLDITDQVLARLKQLGPPSASASSSTSTPSVGPTSRPTGVKRP